MTAGCSPALFLFYRKLYSCEKNEERLIRRILGQRELSSLRVDVGKLDTVRVELRFLFLML